jgi:ribosomal-protein-serine acetyltransferase
MQTTPPWTPPASCPTRFEANGLVLRSYVASDADALFEAVEESRQTLLPWLPWAQSQHRSPAASAECIDYFATTREKLLDAEMGSVGAVCGVFCPRTSRLLGGTGVNRCLPHRHTGELGYWVRSSERRKGICTRAAAAMVSWCFTPQNRGGFGLRRVHIFAAAANAASVGVAKKLGLHCFGRMRQDRFELGYGWVDTIGWDVLADEWDPVLHALRRSPA